MQYGITGAGRSLEEQEFFLPGFLPNHSIVMDGAFQKTDTSNALFGNRMPYSRGYNAAYFARMWKMGFNYHFPLMYPDWGFGNIFYLQRIRANGFYDMTRVFSNNKRASADQRSVGGEIYFDTKWWNQYELALWGTHELFVRPGFLFTGQSKTPIWEFILPVSIIPR